jgi:hypothetical protein
MPTTATALAGIDAATKRCVTVGENSPAMVEEIRAAGHIAVPVSVATARSIWGEPVPDIYAIAAPTGNPPCAP